MEASESKRVGDPIAPPPSVLVAVAVTACKSDVELRLGHYLGSGDESDLMGSQAGVQARPYSV